jgi:hypothetical protein
MRKVPDYMKAFNGAYEYVFETRVEDSRSKLLEVAEQFNFFVWKVYLKQ